MSTKRTKDLPSPTVLPPSEAAVALATTTHSLKELLHELQVHQVELEMQNQAMRQAQIALEDSRDRYVNLYDFAPVGFVTLSRDGLITEMNLAAAELFGVERAKLRHRRFSSLVAPAELDIWRRRIAAIWQGQNPLRLRFELQLKHGDGSLFSAQFQCVTMEPAGSEPVVRMAITDVSERRRLEEEQRIAAIAFESQEGIVVTDADGIIIKVNSAFCSLTGYSQAEALGRTPELLKSDCHDSAFYKGIRQTLQRTRYWQGEAWACNKGGELFATWLTITAVTTASGSISHYVGAFSDTTRNCRAAAEIHRLAYYDPLTHLPNRRLLQDRLSQALTAATRNGLYGAILFLDLDNFKTLNDTRGHDIGDMLLVEVAKRLCSCLREGDTAARLGGDEFVVILEGLSEQAAEAAVLAGHIGGKLNQVVAQPFNLGGVEFHHTVSIGARLFCKHETVEELLKHADLALYQAKNAGRNTVRFFDPAMQAALDQRIIMENELRQALKRGQLQLYFQPQIDSEHGIVSAETLLRWHHPERGLVTPDDFIHIAEETELIVPIGRWVLEQACAQLKLWSESSSTRDLTLSVNVSSRQFRQPDFVDQIGDVLSCSGANPGHLKLELTESLMLDNVVDTIQKMLAIQQLGVRFSMDDFGTGFSSLSYLTRLPLNQLKIDKSFVFKVPEHGNDSVIVTTIISMAKSLGLSIIAEGVETQAQRDFLDSHGCHAYQGFLFSQPLPLERFEELVREV